MRSFTNWENVSIGDPQQIPHAYLRQAVAMFHDGVTAGSYNACPFRSKYVNREDVFGQTSQSNTSVTLESVGAHNAAVGNFSGIFTVYKQTSNRFSPSPSEFRYIKKVHIPVRDTQDYYYSSNVAWGDYRVIQGMPFQSGDEWLTWCKAH